MHNYVGPVLAPYVEGSRRKAEKRRQGSKSKQAPSIETPLLSVV